jgi:hypothetical protein
MNLTYRFLLVFTLLALSGCGQPVYYLMPDPIGDDRSGYEYTPDRDKNGTIAVGFATNRTIAPVDSGKYYAKEYDSNLRFGNAFIQIGSGDESWEEILDISLDANRNEKDVPLTLTGVHRMGNLPGTAGLENLPPDIKRLFAEVNNSLERYPSKEATVYLHGANTSFYRAAALGAQYHHFSGRLSPFIVYAWPSAESLIQYRKDVANIEATVPTFVRFIQLLARNTNVEKINILSYSAGAQLATKALAVLGSDHSNPDREQYRKSLRLGTIYFAAPDAEFDAFIGQLRSYIDLVENVTITISEDDSVLKLSQRFSKKSRLGMPDPEEADPEEREWAMTMSRTTQLDIIEIDAGVIPDLEPGAHNYWYNSPWVSGDTIIMMAAGLTPEERGLVVTDTKRGGQIWTFPPDYDQRIETTLQGLREGWLLSLAKPE